MVLARELHEKIKNIQIKVESSKRLFSIEEELEGTKDAIHLLTAKFEKLNQALSSNAEPDDQLQKIKKIAEASDNVEVVDHTEPEQEEGEEDDTEQDIEEDEEDDDPEPDYDDDDEEEQETEEQIDARQECQLKDILTASQLPKVSTLDCVAGYNEAKEKQIADIIKDNQWLKIARNDANELLRLDSKLESRENLPLRQTLAKMKAFKNIWNYIS